MGFWKGVWEVTKTVTKAAAVGTIAVGLTAATGGVGAVLIGAGVAAEGYCIKKAAEESDNEFFQKVGDFVKDVGVDTLTGGVGGILSDSSKVGKTVADIVKAAEKSERELNEFRAIVSIPGLSGENLYHDWHKSKGKGYDSDCVVCRNPF